MKDLMERIKLFEANVIDLTKFKHEAQNINQLLFFSEEKTIIDLY